jgi:hypothetical protein
MTARAIEHTLNPLGFRSNSASRKGCPGHEPRQPFTRPCLAKIRTTVIKYIVQQTESASKTLFWIVRDADHSWFYRGPFADEPAALAFAWLENSQNWKKLLREARKARKIMAALETEDAIAA